MDGHTVDLHPGIAPALFRTEWAHVPVGPFRAQAWHQSNDPRMATVETYNNFNLAMARFTHNCLPPLPTYTALLLDEGFRVVLGTCATDDLMRASGGLPGWYGVRAAFEWLEQIEEFDPMDLAVWEGRAMQSATEVEL